MTPVIASFVCYADTDDDIVDSFAVKIRRRALIRFSLYPLMLLAVMLLFPLPLYYMKIFRYTLIMPDILVFTGVFVMFFGAFYDFGSKGYIKNILDNRLPFSDKDMDHIYKQQFKLTAIYLGIGFMFILSGVVIFVL